MSGKLSEKSQRRVAGSYTYAGAVLPGRASLQTPPPGHDFTLPVLPKKRQPVFFNFETRRERGGRQLAKSIPIDFNKLLQKSSISSIVSLGVKLFFFFIDFENIVFHRKSAGGHGP